MARFIPVKRPDGSEVASDQTVANLGGGKSLADVITSLGTKTLGNIFDAVTDLQGPDSKTLTDVVTSLGSKTLGDIFDAVGGLKGAGSKTLTDVVSASDLTTDAVDSLKGTGAQTLTDVVSASDLTTDAVDSLKGTGSKTLTDVVSASDLTTDAVDSLKGTGSKTLTDIVTSLGTKTLENIFDAVTDLKGSGSKTLTDIVTALGAKTLENIFDAVTDLKGSGSKTLTDVVTALAGLPVSLGAKLSAASLSVTPATDAVVVVAGKSAVGELPTVNPVGVAGVDLSGFKRTLRMDALGQIFATEQDSEVFTASAAAASVLFTADMTNWRSVLLQVTDAGTSCTIIYECSNDQSVWYPVMGNYTNYSVNGTLAAITTDATTATVQIQFPKRAKYFRARVSVYGSGTVSVAYTLSLEDATSAAAISVWGQAAQGSTVNGNPVTIGIESRTSRKNSVTNGGVVRPIGTVDGKLIVRSHSIPENEWQYAAASGGITNTTTAATLVAAQAAGVRNYLTSLQISSDVLGAATEIAIRDGAGGTVLWRGKIGTAGIAGVSTIQFSDPLKSTAATLLEVVTLSASVFGGVYVNAQGYFAP